MFNFTVNQKQIVMERSERIEELSDKIEALREGYGKIERIDPCGKAYSGLVEMLKKLEVSEIEILYISQIKWISYECGKMLKIEGIYSKQKNSYCEADLIV